MEVDIQINMTNEELSTTIANVMSPASPKSSSNGIHESNLEILFKMKDRAVAINIENKLAVLSIYFQCAGIDSSIKVNILFVFLFKIIIYNLI